MPYQLIIYRNGKQEITAEGSQEEIYKAMFNKPIDPETTWEMKWVAAPTNMDDLHTNSQLGQVKRNR